jgi:hypothetical protein
MKMIRCETAICPIDMKMYVIFCNTALYQVYLLSDVLLMNKSTNYVPSIPMTI